MKLLRYGPAGSEKPGIIDAEGNIRDLSDVVPDISGDVLSPEGLAKIEKADLSKLPLVDRSERLGPCVAGTGKFICIGLNYSDFIRAHRIGLAVEMMLRHHVTVKEVAYAVGFNCVATFERHFKKEIGMSSSRFRAKCLSE